MDRSNNKNTIGSFNGKTMKVQRPLNWDETSSILTFYIYKIVFQTNLHPQKVQKVKIFFWLGYLRVENYRLHLERSVYFSLFTW